MRPAPLRGCDDARPSPVSPVFPSQPFSDQMESRFRAACGSVVLVLLSLLQSVALTSAHDLDTLMDGGQFFCRASRGLDCLTFSVINEGHTFGMRTAAVTLRLLSTSRQGFAVPVLTVDDDLVPPRR